MSQQPTRNSTALFPDKQQLISEGSKNNTEILHWLLATDFLNNQTNIKTVFLWTRVVHNSGTGAVKHKFQPFLESHFNQESWTELVHSD